jgi:hypothetical protein
MTTNRFASLFVLAASMSFAGSITSGDDNIQVTYTVFASQPGNPAAPLAANSTIILVNYTSINPEYTLFRVTVNYTKHNATATPPIATSYPYDDYGTGQKAVDPKNPFQPVFVNLGMANALVTLVQVEALGSGAKGTLINEACRPSTSRGG